MALGRLTPRATARVISSHGRILPREAIVGLDRSAFGIPAGLIALAGRLDIAVKDLSDMKPSVQLFEIASPSPSAPRARQIDLANVTLL